MIHLLGATTVRASTAAPALPREVATAASAPAAGREQTVINPRAATASLTAATAPVSQTEENIAVAARAAGLGPPVTTRPAATTTRIAATAAASPTGAGTAAAVLAAGVGRHVITPPGVTARLARTAARAHPKGGITRAGVPRAGLARTAAKGRRAIPSRLLSTRLYRAQEATSTGQSARRRASMATRPPEHKPRPHVAATSQHALGGAVLVHRAIQFRAQPSWGTTTLL
eukprot:COSAG01_NODE_1706_length_9427_cov_51.196934_4_plen_230_part_00